MTHIKRIPLTIIAIAITYAANAQDNNFDAFKDRQFIFDSLNICAVLLVIYIISNFILRIVRQSLDFKLKNRIIDKQTNEGVVAQILQPESKKEKRNYILQWFCIMSAVGIGFIGISLFPPFGVHSLAIMACSIAAGFGGYYFFTREAKN